MVRIIDTTMVSLGYLTRRGLDLIQLLISLGLTPEVPYTHLPEGLSTAELSQLRLRIPHPRYLPAALSLPVERVVFLWRPEWESPLLALKPEERARLVAHFPKATAVERAEFLSQARRLEDLGLGGLIFGDREGLMDPFAIYQRLKEIRGAISLPLEVETSNAFGLAGANLLAGARAGVWGLRSTVGGLGGQGATEEVVMACRHLLNLPLFVETSGFAALARSTAALIGRRVPLRKAIVGSETFSHESGIHVDGALKEPATYEAFRPEEVGLIRRIILGKHSGSASIRAVLARFQLTAEPAEIKGLLGKIRRLVEKRKGPVDEEELLQWVHGA